MHRKSSDASDVRACHRCAQGGMRILRHCRLCGSPHCELCARRYRLPTGWLRGEKDRDREEVTVCLGCRNKALEEVAEAENTCFEDVYCRQVRPTMRFCRVSKDDLDIHPEARVGDWVVGHPIRRIAASNFGMHTNVDLHCAICGNKSTMLGLSGLHTCRTCGEAVCEKHTSTTSDTEKYRIPSDFKKARTRLSTVAVGFHYCHDCRYLLKGWKAGGPSKMIASEEAYARLFAKRRDAQTLSSYIVDVQAPCFEVLTFGTSSTIERTKVPFVPMRQSSCPLIGRTYTSLPQALHLSRSLNSDAPSPSVSRTSNSSSSGKKSKHSKHRRVMTTGAIDDSLDVCVPETSTGNHLDVSPEVTTPLHFRGSVSPSVSSGTSTLPTNHRVLTPPSAIREPIETGDARSTSTDSGGLQIRVHSDDVLRERKANGELAASAWKRQCDILKKENDSFRQASHEQFQRILKYQTLLEEAVNLLKDRVNLSEIPPELLNWEETMSAQSVVSKDTLTPDKTRTSIESDY